MATTKVYQLPVDKTGWQTGDGTGAATFTWDYDDGREKLSTCTTRASGSSGTRTSGSTGRHDLDLENPL